MQLCEAGRIYRVAAWDLSWSVSYACAPIIMKCPICICIGGLVYVGGSRLELKLKIDDPLDAFAVHIAMWRAHAPFLAGPPLSQLDQLAEAG